MHWVTLATEGIEFQLKMSEKEVWRGLFHERLSEITEG